MRPYTVSDSGASRQLDCLLLDAHLGNPPDVSLALSNSLSSLQVFHEPAPLPETTANTQKVDQPCNFPFPYAPLGLENHCMGHYQLSIEIADT